MTAPAGDGDRADRPTLVARTRRLDVDVDLIDVAGETGLLWQRGRAGFAGRGEALAVAGARRRPGRRPPRPCTTRSTAIEVDDEVGPAGHAARSPSAPCPSTRRSTASWSCPRCSSAAAEDGTRWVTTVDRRPTTPASAASRTTCSTSCWPARSTRPTPGPDRGSLHRHDARDRPTTGAPSLVAARDELRAGAGPQGRAGPRGRRRDRPAAAPRRRAAARCAAPTRRACSSPIDGFVGASPELLVARTGDLVRSHPMAGTAPRSADPATDARLAADLLASAKDQVEHRYTIDMVHDTLLPWCSYLDEEAEPSIVAMANVQHLATLVEGRLSSPAGVGRSS